MSLGDRFGLAGVILTLFGIAAAILWPDKRWIGWVSLSCAGLLLIVWLRLEVRANLPDFSFRHPVWFFVFVFIVGGCVAITLVRLLLPMKAPPQIGSSVNTTTAAKPTERPPTLLDLFTSDFPSVLKLTDSACELHWRDGSKFIVRCQLYLDFDGKNEFVGLYVPERHPDF